MGDRRNQYTDRDREIMREEIARGAIGWVQRAAARIPDHSPTSIQTHASAHGMTKRGAVAPAPRPKAAPAPSRGYQPRRPSSENVPDFLRDVYARWNT